MKFNAQKLKALRAELGYTVEELSQHIAADGHKITKQSISNWESGLKCPTLKSVLILCSFFKRPIPYFFGK